MIGAQMRSKNPQHPQHSLDVLNDFPPNIPLCVIFSTQLVYSIHTPLPPIL